jgi:tRNA-2-methylthio-N6-dimethylallyladenosine synthase
MKKYKNIMPAIHLPVQSGDQQILKKMNRSMKIDDYIKIIKYIHKNIKDCAITTDIIVGFPNETYEDVQKTIEVALKADYSSAFTFIYSPRNGTPAAKLEDNVSNEEKVRRFKELVKALEVNFEKHANEMVGTIQKVLVDGPSKKNKDILSGYTESNKVVNFKGSPDLIGKIINVKITESHVYSLTGEIVDE